MAKEEPITVEGKVLEALGGIRFRVGFGNGSEAICTLAGKMHKMNRIRTNPDDIVLVELCPYDLTRGRIVYRNK